MFPKDFVWGQPVAAGEVAADAGELPVVGRQHRDPDRKSVV